MWHDGLARRVEGLISECYERARMSQKRNNSAMPPSQDAANLCAREAKSNPEKRQNTP